MLTNPVSIQSVARTGIKLVVALALLISPLPVGAKQSIPATLPGAVIRDGLAIPHEPSAFCDSVSQIPLAECQALEALYLSTNGSGWIQNDGWMDTLTPCSWHGIGCTGGNVSSITLNENALQGTIPAQLEDLSQLTSLSMYLNQLSGSIPSELCNLSYLYWFDLGDNLLTGNIPTCIGGLSYLYGFWVGNNQLSGTLPPEFGYLNLIEEIWLQGNQLSGGVPAQWGNLTALRDLRISNNPLSGPLPRSLVNLSALDTFWFNNTNICELSDAPFQTWLSGISELLRTNTDCLLLHLPLIKKVNIQSTWRPASSPTSNNLYSVSMLSTNLGFAVGQNGKIIKWNGTNWAPVSSPVTGDLTSVSIGNAFRAWTVSGNLILRWNGADWNQVAGAPNYPFQGVDAIADKAWLVGGFLVCSPDCDDLTSFISHWDGSSWSTSFSYHKYLYSVDMISATDGFAVGDIYDPSNPQPAIVRWNGSTWDNQTHPAVRGLYDISVLNSNNAWAVGADTNMNCTLLRWNGANWTAYTCPAGVFGLSSISMVSANDVWAVGGDDIIHWNGSNWSRMAVSVPANLYDVDMLSATEGWAVGANGTILHFSP